MGAHMENKISIDFKKSGDAKKVKVSFGIGGGYMEVVGDSISFEADFISDGFESERLDAIISLVKKVDEQFGGA